MIKYIGSKRRLVPVLGEICSAVGARTAVDLFTGTTRVAQEFKRRGAYVTAVDTARYSEVFAQCYIGVDGQSVDQSELDDALIDLSARPDVDGYVTQTFCRDSRFFQPHNGRRVDAIRDAIERDYRGTWLYPVLLTSLIEAADRVDSTTGVQMAYVKQWAARSYRPLQLRVPELLAGAGRAVRGTGVWDQPHQGPSGPSRTSNRAVVLPSDHNAATRKGAEGARAVSAGNDQGAKGATLALRQFLRPARVLGHDASGSTGR